MSETTTNSGVGRVAGAGASPSPAPAAAPAATNAPPPKEGKALRDKTAYRVLDVQRQVDRFGNPISEPFYITYPSDDTQLAAMLKGDKIPFADRKMKRVYAGNVANDIPAVSVARLLADGFIAKADGPDDPYGKQAAKVSSEGGEA